MALGVGLAVAVAGCGGRSVGVASAANDPPRALPTAPDATSADTTAGAGPGSRPPAAGCAAADTTCLVELALGAFHSCARLADGTARCWGSNAALQIGVHSTAPQILTPREPLPVAVPGLANVRQLALGGEFSCALLGDGSVRCWGGADALLGGKGCIDPADCAIDTPTVVRGLAGLGGGTQPVAEIAAGARHLCARRADGVVLCWGRNDGGQVGAGNTDYIARIDWPTQVGLASPALSVSAGGEVSCAIVAYNKGSVRCWGRGYGSTPHAIAGLTGGGWTAVGVGVQLACARRFTGEVLCWAHERPSKSLPDAPDPTIPRPVAGLPAAASVAVGGMHACAIAAADGALYCWGENGSGQLGIGDARPHAGAQRVKTGGAVSRVALGRAHTCARNIDDPVPMCWGMNWYGQVGDGHDYGESKPLAPTTVVW